MGRLDANPPSQSSDQTTFPPSSPPPAGYPNQHQNPLSSPPPQAGNYVPNNDQNMNYEQSARSYVPQSPQSMPPPESYPPQKPATYPPEAEAYPPQKPAAYPPEAEAYPPQKPAAYSPQPEPVQFPPQPEAVQFPPQAQSYNYVYNNGQAQAQGVNYGGPVPMDGIAVGSQYLAPTQGWRNGLFDCGDDPENALITACFPCITFGQIAEVVDNGQTSCATSGLIYGLIAAFIGIPCIMSCSYRTKIRNRYGLMETPAPDWVTHCFCEWCALCQEYRELKYRGLDPAIGWQGNMLRNQQMQHNPTMTPPMNQTMMG